MKSTQVRIVFERDLRGRVRWSGSGLAGMAAGIHQL